MEKDHQSSGGTNASNQAIHMDHSSGLEITVKSSPDGSTGSCANRCTASCRHKTPGHDYVNGTSRMMNRNANSYVVQDMYTKANRAIRDSQNDLRSKSIESLDGTTARSTNVFESILASKVLPTKEKEANRIAQEGFVVLVAGGETTARVLTTATFHILAKKETVLLRLKEELATVMVDPDTQVDVKTLEQLPWLVSPLSRDGNGRD